MRKYGPEENEEGNGAKRNYITALWKKIDREARQE